MARDPTSAPPRDLEWGMGDRGGIEFEQSRTVSELLKKAKDKAAGTASAIKFSYELVEAAGGEHASSRAS